MLQLDHPLRTLGAELSGGLLRVSISGSGRRRRGERLTSGAEPAPPGGCGWKKFLRGHGPCQDLSYAAGLSALRPPCPLLAPSPKASPATGSGLPLPLRGPEALPTRVNSLFSKLTSVYPLESGSVGC